MEVRKACSFAPSIANITQGELNEYNYIEVNVHNLATGIS